MSRYDENGMGYDKMGTLMRYKNQNFMNHMIPVL